MDKEAYEVRREQWRRIVTECINECHNSGMSKKEWCRQNNISIRGIYYWQRKFRSEAVEGTLAASGLPAPAGTDVKRELSPAQEPPVIFADITENIQKCLGPDCGSQRDSDVPELMLEAGSHRIYVYGSIRKQTLETVMKVLSHA